MDVRLVPRAAQQEDLIAAWQLLRDGWSRKAIRWHASHEHWRLIHDGVWALGQAPLTQRQLWIAATLTAPGTWLNAFSAANAYGFHLSDLGYETVVREGSGGKLMLPGRLVARSKTLDGVVGRRAGIAIVSPERALIDIAAALTEGRLGRAFRESIRLGTTTAIGIAKALTGQRGRRAVRG